MNEQASGGPPIFNDMPAVIVLLVATITVVSVAVFVLPTSYSWAIIDAAAVSIGYDHAQPLGPYAPFALHAFVHVTWAHLALNMTALLAFGAGAARGLGGGARGVFAVLVLFFLSVIGGAVTEAVFRAEQQLQMAGASGGVFGLIAGAVYMYRADVGQTPTLLSASYLTGLAPWVGINLLLPVGALVFAELSLIAWKAHLGGLVVGAILYPVMLAWTRAEGRQFS